MSSKVHTLGPHCSWAKASSCCCSCSSGKLVQMILLNIAVSAALMLGEPDRYSLDRAFGISLPAWVELLGLVDVIVAMLSTPRSGSTGRQPSGKKRRARRGRRGPGRGAQELSGPKGATGHPS